MARWSRRPRNCKGDLSTYFKMAKESLGFDVNGSGRVLSAGISEANKDSSMVIEAAEAAVDIYNEEHNSNLIFESVVKVNGQAVGGFIYYITLKARLPTDKHSKVYQAKVFMPGGFDEDEFVLLLFRERPILPNIPKGAFLFFMNGLRKHPLVEKIRRKDVTTLASRIWKSMLHSEKLRYYETRNLDEFVNLNVIVRAFLRSGI